MKITKAKLKQIIKEELSTLKEGDRTPDDVEVQIEGYGKLEIGQIRNGLTKRVAEALRVDWRADPLRGLDHLLAGGVVEAFYKTLKAHNAYWPAEEEE
jgi:hypothetical protein